MEEEVWEEFNGNWDKLAYEGELLITQVKEKAYYNMPKIDIKLFPQGIDRETIVKTRPMYRLYRDKITLLTPWYEYLRKHMRIIRDYVYWNLSLFLQARNPNVPDIPNKLIKPAMRNSLIKQRNFWDYVIDKAGPLQCIYTGKELYKGLYHVEHFVPYSFVSHDQIWNLIPADNSFNITKSNKLPSLERYFEPFYEMQRRALDVYLKEQPKQNLLEDYFYIGTDLEEGLSKEKFYDVLNPLITIAANNGFEFMKV